MNFHPKWSPLVNDESTDPGLDPDRDTEAGQEALLQSTWDDGEAAMIRQLQAAHLVVLNYGKTLESTSGVASMAMGSGRPIAMSTEPIFDEVRPFGHTLHGGDLASEILALLSTEEAPGAEVARRVEIERRASFRAVAERLLALYES